MNKNNLNSKECKCVFSPLFLLHIRKSEKFLSEMEQNGRKLFKVRMGCLLYFIPCKAKENVSYYFTQSTKYRFNEIAWTYGKKALKAKLASRYIKKSELLSFELKGLGYSKMYFTLYRFNNGEIINVCKNIRRKDISYFADWMLYFCVNVFTPIILLCLIVQHFIK